MMLYDPEWPFYVKFCFRICATRAISRGFRRQLRENKDARILPAGKVFLRDSSLRRYKLYADIRGGSL